MGQKLLDRLRKRKEPDQGTAPEEKQRGSIRLARFIIRRKGFIESLFVAGCIFSALAMLFVNVNYDLTEYLPATAESRIGLDKMEDEFGYPGTARVMIKDVDVYKRQGLDGSSRVRIAGN